MQVLNQVEGICIVFVYDAIVSLIILKIIDAIIGLRVSEEVEREGLDLALHGETVRIDKLAVGAETRHCPFRRGPGSQEPGASLLAAKKSPARWPGFIRRRRAQVIASAMGPLLLMDAMNIPQRNTPRPPRLHAGHSPRFTEWLIGVLNAVQSYSIQ